MQARIFSLMNEKLVAKKDSADRASEMQEGRIKCVYERVLLLMVMVDNAPM